MMLKINKFQILKLSYRNFILFIPLVLKRITKGKVNNQIESQSELKSISPIVNRIILIIFKIENFILRYFNYFIGGTIFWIGMKSNVR